MMIAHASPAGKINNGLDYFTCDKNTNLTAAKRTVSDASTNTTNSMTKTPNTAYRKTCSSARPTKCFHLADKSPWNIIIIVRLFLFYMMYTKRSRSLKRRIVSFPPCFFFLPLYITAFSNDHPTSLPVGWKPGFYRDMRDDPNKSRQNKTRTSSNLYNDFYPMAGHNPTYP